MHTSGKTSRTPPSADGESVNASTLRAACVAAYGGADEASDLLQRLLRGFDGSLALRLWNGATFTLGKTGLDQTEPRFTLVCHDPTVVRSLVLGRDPLWLAEAFFRGDIDVEGDFFAALSLKDHLHSIRLSFRDRLGAVFTALRLRTTSGAQSGPGSHSSSLHGRAVRVSGNRSELTCAVARILYRWPCC